MTVTTVDNIITKKILNEDTGELEPTTFIEQKKTKKLRGGFSMTYKSYDDVIVAATRSQKDLEVIVHIKNMFTYRQVETNINAAELGGVFDLSRQKITTLVKRLVALGLIMKVTKSRYRLNPFIFIPYRSDGPLLQAEWNELLKTQRHLAVYKALEITDRHLDPIVTVKPSNKKVVETHPHISIYNSLKTEYVRTRFKDMMDKGSTMNEQFLSYAIKMDEGIYKKEKEENGSK